MRLDIYRLALSAAVTLALAASVAALDGCIWEDRAPCPLPRVEGPSVAVDGRVFVFGGFYDQALHATPQVHAYDPATDSWTRRADMPVAVTHAGLALDSQTVWIAGGFSGNHPGAVVASVFKYDTVTDTWSSGPALPAPRGSGGLVRLERQLHFFGGVSSDKETSLGEHFVLDLDNPGGWTLAAPLPIPRNHFGSAALAGKAYVIGGQFGHDIDPIDQAHVHAYDPLGDTWSEVAPLPFGRSHMEPGTLSTGARLLVVGGRANGMGAIALPDITEYDPVEDTWTALPPLPVGLLAPVACVQGAELFVSAGGLGPFAPQAASYTRLQSARFGEMLRFNAGGGALLAPGSQEEWCVDMGAMDGQPYTNTALATIAGTDNDELYLTERTGNNEHPTRFGYRIPVPAGLYRVRLHFAEIYWGVPGGGPAGSALRVFDVVLEETLVLDDYDISGTVGAATAVVHSFDMPVTDGMLDLDFIASVDRPKLSGLEIQRLDDDAFESYCVAAPNSAGAGAHIGFGGNISVADNQFTLEVQGAPPGVTGLFLQGVTRPQAPLGSGFRCVGGAVYRLPPLVQTSSAGVVNRQLDTTAATQASSLVLPGASWNFQLWYRDSQTSNLSDGLGVTFTD
ncbi:MAG: N-acetylneuraminic acid mutarotase [Chlamydiales bacterium]|jgi:N-acetylneuraminic acid mutarotase